MKASLKRRVEALERHGNLFDLDPVPTAGSDVVPPRYADGTFTGVIQDGDGIRVRITRAVTLSRDADGSWIVFSHDDTNPVDDNSIRVEDATACLALDYVFELLADPDDVGEIVVHERDADD